MKSYPLRVVLTLALLSPLIASKAAWSHCQIPCGIYDDAARINRLKEDAKTIEKSITEIQSLAGKSDAQSLNQITRWINNKEEHANNIIEVTANYFLAQRVKSDAPKSKYQQLLQEHHQVIVAAMKVKQNSDLKAVKALNLAIDAVAAHYKPHSH